MSSKKFKLAILASHLIPYQAPFFRKLAEHPCIDLMVYYCLDFGIGQERLDPGFEVKYKWDVPLLDGYQYTFLKNRAITPSPFKFSGLFNPQILTELRRHRYDAICIHGYVHLSSWLAFLGAWFYGIPVIFRGEADLTNLRCRVKRIIKKSLLVPLFKRIDTFLYSYRANKEYYQHYGVPENKLIFFPCAVDNAFWQKQADKLKDSKDVIKKQLGMSPGSHVILFSGKFIPRKRAMDLLRAYELLCRRKQLDISLLFVGSGQEENSLKSYVRNKKLNNIYFVGFKNQNEISSFYSIADVLVISSSRDPSPKVVNEVMNFSVPVIAADMVGTACDLIKSGENGFVYPTGDVNALTDCLQRIFEDENDLDRMRINTRKIVSQWSFEQDSNAMLDALEYVTRIRR